MLREIKGLARAELLVVAAGVQGQAYPQRPSRMVREDYMRIGKLVKATGIKAG